MRLLVSPIGEGNGNKDETVAIIEYAHRRIIIMMIISFETTRARFLRVDVDLYVTTCLHRVRDEKMNPNVKCIINRRIRTPAWRSKYACAHIVIVVVLYNVHHRMLVSELNFNLLIHLFLITMTSFGAKITIM